MNKTTVIKIICIFIGLVTAKISAGESVFLRGNIISSNGNGHAVDSVIVRLLNSGQSVYTADDGSFVIGDSKVMIRKGREISSKNPLLVNSGVFFKPGGFPDGTRINIYNLQGKCREILTYGKCSEDGKIDITNVVRRRSWNESIAGIVHLSATDPLNKGR